MLPSPESRIFFDRSTIIAERWGLERIANAARRLLPSDPAQHMFIKLESYMDCHLHFSVVLGCTPNLPLRMWKATVIDDETDPELRCITDEDQT